MPGPDVDELEVRAPGFLASRLVAWSQYIDARLRKRYEVPFGDPFPEIVRIWLTALVTVDAYQKRGWDPGSEQDELINDARQAALADLREAADAETGLFDLPLRQNNAASGISQGGPFGYSEASPYEWTDVQRGAIRGR